MEKAELYLSIAAVWVEMRLHHTQVARGIPAGRYEALAGGSWVAVEASEPHISTSARPLRAVDAWAGGAAAAALLRVGRSPLALRDAAGRAFDVGFERLGHWLYVGGDFARGGEGHGEPFQCRAALPGGAALVGEAAERAWRGQRALLLSALAPADMAALADAVAAGASVPLERVAWR